MTELVTTLAILVLVWFAGGTIWNVRRGRALMRWMQDGLPRLGEKTTVRWLGSTAVELVIRQAAAPFGAVTVVIFLEPRDIPWMWALARSRGRRDTLIVRGALRRAPTVDLDALDRLSWSGRDALRSLGGNGWSVREPAAAGALAVYYKTPAALRQADALTALAVESGLSVRRLAVRRTEPHFQLHVAPPGASTSASEFFEAVRALAERAPA
jgi:hypothetical protein